MSSSSIKEKHRSSSPGWPSLEEPCEAAATPEARQGWRCDLFVHAHLHAALPLHHAVPHVVIDGGKQVQRAIESIW